MMLALPPYLRRVRCLVPRMQGDLRDAFTHPYLNPAHGGTFTVFRGKLMKPRSLTSSALPEVGPWGV